MQGFDFSRALIGLQCVGRRRPRSTKRWHYTHERNAFGAPIAQFQGVTFPLAEAETKLTMMRQLCYLHAGAARRRLPHTAEAAMCKWLAPKLALRHHPPMPADPRPLRLHDGLPFHQQRLRDVMGLEIGDGTAQIMKLIIAREKVGRIAVQYAKQTRYPRSRAHRDVIVFR